MSLVNIQGLFNETLLEGSYRGIGFSFIDSRDSAGRRIQAWLFPGQDRQAFQDLGQLDGDIQIQGILSGDDVTHQADRLRDAFQKPGPATLDHPWLGDLLVIQAPGHAPEFKFDHEHLRILTFSATFRLFHPRQPQATDTLQGLLDALTDLRTAALGFLRRILRPIALVLSIVGRVERLAGEVASVFAGLILSARNPLVGLAGSLPVGLLSGIGGVAPGDGYADAVGGMLAAPSAAIAATTTPTKPSAVAPGGVTAMAEPVDGRVTAGLILSASAAIAPASGAVDAPIRVAIQATMIADAVQAASDIEFESQQEAIAWRDRIAAALDAAAARVAELVVVEPTEAGKLWRGLVAARAAWLADMTETIGRLPPVLTIEMPTPTPVWLIAHHLVGDDPARMLSTYRDIVGRNDIRHPAEPPAGPLEALA